MQLKYVTSVITLVVASAAMSLSVAAAEVAERIFRGGVIWTGASDTPDATAIAISAGKVLAVGAEDEIMAYQGPMTDVLNLSGRFLMPGFTDNHVHFEMGSNGLSQVQLRDAATPAEFARRIAEAAANAPEGAWVLEGAWDHELWGGELPDRAWIDEATADVPVAVTRLDGHMILANTKAMTMAGIGPDTPNPEGGVIVRDANGRATGVFKDNAIPLVMTAMTPPSNAAMEKIFKDGIEHALSLGVTQVHDMGYDWRSLETFQRLKAKGELRIRVYAFTPLAEWEKLETYLDAHGRGDDSLRWGALKGFVDGSLGSTTAWFYKPYSDEPDTAGFPIANMKELEADVVGASSAGLHVTVHAIGYQANDRLLDIFERASEGRDPKKLRFRIEHAQHLTADAISRFAPLGVTASMHPYHLIDDGRWAEKRIGKERLKGTYAIGSVMETGANVTFGSDWSVAPLDPLQGIYAAVARRTTDGKNPDGWIASEKITVAQALKAYTQNNAYAGFMDGRSGMLKAGYVADLVVLSDNPFEVTPAKLTNIKVLHTVVGGEDRFISEDQ